ncbi:MAG: glycosyltransferase family 4 protein [Bacteroidetes bacterium]|nr:glycosyltransferase family 4 protein [Bacteroidota bacterium]MBL7104162.1 glycosyltransferase family 4 protein [Bacteroidales bacterium]
MMKIINIIPGFGGAFYCGNCQRDSDFTKALKETGHQAHTLPIYLPLFADDSQNEKEVPVFYGAVNIYLKQKFKIFRKMPKWLYRFFDSSPILKFAAKKSGSTRAKGLEEMTLSMLMGHEGYQKEELQMLIDYLRDHEKPDVVHLSNALLLGLAHKIKTELNIPVVCSLQDEDVWIDAMEKSWQERLWKLMGEKAEDVSAFITVSDYFANLMKKNMNIPDEKIHVFHIGVDPEKYYYNMPKLDPPVIGYLSRMNKGNGFEVLIDAFINLKDKTEFKNARLRVTGGKTSDDDRFIKKQIAKLKKRGYHHDIEFYSGFSSTVSPDFFTTLTVLSVPALKGEAFGLYQLEAMASGIPTVQPALAAFPEIAKVLGGGVVYEPNSPEALSAKWAEVFSDPDILKQMSFNGRQSIRDKFNLKVYTGRIIDVYNEVTSSGIRKAVNE